MSLKEVVPSPSDTAAPARRSSTRFPSETPLRPPARTSVPGLAREAIDDLIGLFTSQIELTRAEFRQDARAALRGGLALLVFVPFLIVGYCLLLGAAFVVLAPAVGALPTLLAGGLLHVVGAGLGLWRAVRKLSAVHFLDRSGAELEKSVDRVAEAMKTPPPRLPSPT